MYVNPAAGSLSGGLLGFPMSRPVLREVCTFRDGRPRIHKSGPPQKRGLYRPRRCFLLRMLVPLWRSLPKSFFWDIKYKGSFTLPAILHQLTVHLWQSDNQQRKYNGTGHGLPEGGHAPSRLAPDQIHILMSFMTSLWCSCIIACI